MGKWARDNHYRLLVMWAVYVCVGGGGSRGWAPWDQITGKGAGVVKSSASGTRLSQHRAVNLPMMTGSSRDRKMDRVPMGATLSRACDSQPVSLCFLTRTEPRG